MTNHNEISLRIVGDKTEAKCTSVTEDGKALTFYGWGRNGVEAANKVTKEIRKDIGKGVRLSFEGMNTSWST